MHPRSYINLVPSLYEMEIFEFQDGDPTYQYTRPDGTVVPMGISVASLQQRLGGDEGDYTSPTGETYHISLALWEGNNHEKTLLHMTFHATPLLPADIAPEFTVCHACLPLLHSLSEERRHHPHLPLQVLHP